MVYLPILALTGIEGKMFKPMAITVVMALVGALILTLTLIPALCTFFLGGEIKEGENILVRWLRSKYELLLRWCLNHTALVTAGSVILFLISVGVFTRLGAIFIPKLDEGSVALEVLRPASIGLETSIRMEEKSEKVLLAIFPEVKSTFSRIGTAEVATDPMGVNSADTYIFFKPESEWSKINGKQRTKEQLVEAIKEELEKRVPGQAMLFTQPIELRFNEILEGTKAEIAVKIFGDDFDELDRIADQARDILNKVPGAGDVEFDALGKSPILEIVIDRAAIKRYGLHASEINDLVSVAMGGKSVGLVLEGNRRSEIVVRMPEEWRQRIEDLHQLPVRTHDGGLITLGQVTKINLTEQVNMITRENGRRRVAIMVNLRGRDVESFVREAEAKIKAEVKMPQGYYLEWGGQFQNLRQARQRLLIVVPGVLIMIFFLIFATFQSLRQALIVYTGIPLAVTGGIFALAIRGLPFSISAGVGFIALSGVAVLNGVVLVNYFNQLRETGRSVPEAVWEGSLTWLRAILMTSLVAGLGFVPMAIATGAGAEVQKPLATVVIGGIFSSTFLTLILLPALYQRFENHFNSK